MICASCQGRPSRAKASCRLEGAGRTSIESEPAQQVGADAVTQGIAGGDHCNPLPLIHRLLDPVGRLGDRAVHRLEPNFRFQVRGNPLQVAPDPDQTVDCPHSRPRGLGKPGPAFPRDADERAGLRQAHPPRPVRRTGPPSRRQGRTTDRAPGSVGAGCEVPCPPVRDERARRGRGSEAAPRQSER